MCLYVLLFTPISSIKKVITDVIIAVVNFKVIIYYLTFFNLDCTQQDLSVVQDSVTRAVHQLFKDTDRLPQFPFKTLLQTLLRDETLQGNFKLS